MYHRRWKKQILILLLKPKSRCQKESGSPKMFVQTENPSEQLKHEYTATSSHDQWRLAAVESQCSTGWTIKLVQEPKNGYIHRQVHMIEHKWQWMKQLQLCVRNLQRSHNSARTTRQIVANTDLHSPLRFSCHLIFSDLKWKFIYIYNIFLIRWFGFLQSDNEVTTERTREHFLCASVKMEKLKFISRWH